MYTWFVSCIGDVYHICESTLCKLESILNDSIPQWEHQHIVPRLRYFLMTHHGNFTKTQRTNVWFSPRKHHLHLIQQCRKSTPSPEYLGVGEQSHVCECKEIFASSRWQAYSLSPSQTWDYHFNGSWHSNKGPVVNATYCMARKNIPAKVSFLAWFLGCPPPKKSGTKLNRTSV